MKVDTKVAMKKATMSPTSIVRVRMSTPARALERRASVMEAAETVVLMAVAAGKTVVVADAADADLVPVETVAEIAAAGSHVTRY